MTDDTFSSSTSLPHSEAITRGIRVRVTSTFDPERSSPNQGSWFYLYTVTVENLGEETVQLLSRHWIITNGVGHVEEVKGEGVVGAQPVLAPGEGFEYTSGCPLPTANGSMHGTYQMVSEDGETFDIEIAPFGLGTALMVN